MSGRSALAWLPVALVPVLISCATTPSPEEGLKRSSDAMGASNLQSLRYATEGTGWTFGQAYTPGTAWPRITVHSQIRTIDYANGAMREEFTLSRAEPRGGGG